MSGRTIERVILAVLVVVVLVETYLAFSAYTTVQAQTAKVAALEREAATLRSEVDGRVKKLEDDLSRIRR